MNDWRDNHLVTNAPAPTEPTYLSVVISLALFLLCTRGFLFMCNGNGYFTFQATGMSAPIDLTVILWLSVACSFVDGSVISEYVLIRYQSLSYRKGHYINQKWHVIDPYERGA